MSAPRAKGALKAKRRASAKRAIGPPEPDARQLNLKLDHIMAMMQGHGAATAKASSISFKALADRYIAEHLAILEKGTYSTNRSYILNHIVPVIGGLELHALTKNHFMDVRKAALESGLIASSADVVTRLGVRVLRFGVEENLVAAAPKVKLPKGVQSRTRWYTEDQVEKLLAAARHSGRQHTVTVLLLGVDAGLRSGEMQALTWPAITDRIHLFQRFHGGRLGPLKGKRERFVPLTPRLKLHLSRLERDGDYILPASAQKTSGNTWINVRCLANAQRRAGLPYEASHILRHTFCSRLAAAGASPYEIMSLSGHASLKDVMRYIHLDPDGASTRAMRRLHDLGSKQQRATNRVDEV